MCLLSVTKSVTNYLLLTYSLIFGKVRGGGYTRASERGGERHRCFVAALPERHEVVDRLGQLSKTGDGIIGRNCLIRRINLSGREGNCLYPHTFGTADIVV